MQKCPKCSRIFSNDTLQVCPLDNSILENDPPDTISAKYVFIDVVGFTHNRSVEAQSHIVQVLNEIVKDSVRKVSIPERNLLYIPTGDGICVAILKYEKPFDVDLQLALNILERLQKYNDATEKKAYRFKVRIGINENIDNLITDINDSPNIAGAGINMAARIMDNADGNQILVGQSVYERLHPRERYASAFRSHQMTIKHENELVVHQFKSEDYIGLNTDEPLSFKPVLPASKRIVVVIPALAQNSWFAELIQETFRQLHDYDYEVILKIPYKDFSKQEQTTIFKHLERHPDDYIGGIIVIYKHDRIAGELTELCNKLSYPVVFADVPPFDSESDYPANTAFVGYDAKMIGECAARRVARHLREIKKENPVVKVICSATSQTGRQGAFCKELVKQIPGVDIEVKREGAFKRYKAKDIAVSFFNASIKNKKYIDAIFCTNDEMALGVYDAMLTVKYVGFEHPFLIGVDGINSARRLIRAKHAHFNATIKQSTKELSHVIVSILNRKIKKEICPTESSLVPKVYDKEVAQAEDDTDT
ncbi:MAG TPA: substrate-binding domain-containing protein [Pyrinomonadaceae bacterium]|nr:substrate-binding domain-containing protein [Pyrinomonadaceae bacterium]